MPYSIQRIVAKNCIRNDESFALISKLSYSRKERESYELALPWSDVRMKKENFRIWVSEIWWVREIQIIKKTYHGIHGITFNNKLLICSLDGGFIWRCKRSSCIFHENQRQIHQCSVGVLTVVFTLYLSCLSQRVTTTIFRRRFCLNRNLTELIL